MWFFYQFIFTKETNLDRNRKLIKVAFSSSYQFDVMSKMSISVFIKDISKCEMLKIKRKDNLLFCRLDIC